MPEDLLGDTSLHCSMTLPPGGFRFKQFENSKLEDWAGSEKITTVVADYIDHLGEHRDKGTGLTFIGPPGSGKTLLATVVLNAAVTAGFRVGSVEMTNLMNLYRRQFAIQSVFSTGDPDAVEEWWHLDRRIKFIRAEYDWVLFDDIGKEYDSVGAPAGWSNSEFSAILRHRYNRGFPFLLTSNYPLRDWGNRYSSSMESFLHEATQILVISTEKDMRKHGPG